MLHPQLENYKKGLNGRWIPYVLLYVQKSGNTEGYGRQVSWEDLQLTGREYSVPFQALKVLHAIGYGFKGG